MPLNSQLAIHNCKLRVSFLREPLGDLLARESVIVVQVNDHWCQRKPLVATLRARLHNLIEAAKQPLEMIRDQLSMLPRKVIHAFVHRAEGTRTALFVEVTAEALMGPAGAGARARPDGAPQFVSTPPPPGSREEITAGV